MVKGIQELALRAHPIEVRDAMAEYGDRVGLTGFVVVRLYDERERLKDIGVFSNLITDVGDEYYMERAAGITSPPDQVSGMRLGTGATAAAKSGAGATIVTHKTGSNVAIDGGFPTSSKPSAARRIQWQSTWAAGVATDAALAEAVITNLNPIGTGAGAAADTISRVVFGSTINKGASDSLVLTWNHDGLGA